MVLAVLFAFVFLVMGVRGRRATANLGIAAFAVSFIALALVARARYSHPDAYIQNYEWMNLQVAINGALQFQGFVMDLDVRIDHLVIGSLGAVLLTGVLVLLWSRIGPRGEVGVPRLHILVVMLVLGAMGVIFSPGMAAILAYWGIASAATYLMLSNRWGTDEARPARIALALPFAGDLTLLAGFALLFSRYGDLDLGRVPGLLHSTPGTGLKSLTAACILVIVGAAVRAALVPVHEWITETVTSPPPAVALAQALWPLLAATVLYRFLPLIHAAGPQATVVLGVLGAVGAGGGAILALAGTGFRRAVAATGVAQAGVAFIALAYADPVRAMAGMIGTVPLRAAVVLAAAAIVTGQRSDDYREMGEAWRRMRLSAVALLLGLGGLPLALTQVAAPGMANQAWEAVVAIALALLAFAAMRAYVGVGYGRLERRRTFEPERVRDAPGPLAQFTVALGILGLLIAALTAVPWWINFLGGGHQKAAAPLTAAGLLVVALVGGALAFMTYGANRATWMRLSVTLGVRVAAGRSAGMGAWDRWAWRPVRVIAGDLEGRLVPAVERWVAAPLGLAGGRLDAWAEGGARAGWLALAVGVAAVAGLLAALLSPGVLR